AARLRLAFDRSLRPAITLALGLDVEDGKVIGGRVAIGCAFPAPVSLCLPISEPLSSREAVERAAILARDHAASLPEPMTNQHASARYRRQMIEVLLRRNLATLGERTTRPRISTSRLPPIGAQPPKCAAEPDIRRFTARGSAAH